MSLSKLEKHELREVFNTLKRIKEKYEKHSDSICDVIFHEVGIEATDAQEAVVVKQFLEYSKQSHNDLEKLFDRVEILSDHFIN